MIEIGLEQVYNGIEQALEAKDIDKAEHLLFPALDQFGKDAQLLFYASHILVQRDKYQLARLCCEESIRLSPNGRAYGNLGAIYRRLNNNVMATSMLDKAIEYEPGEKNAWNNKAANFVNEGNPGPGIEAAKKALEIDPKFVKARWNLGLLQLELGEFAEGWDNYREGLALNDRMLRSYSMGDGTGPVMLENLEELLDYETEHGKKPRVIIWGEQGIGDEIMFSTLLEDFSNYAEIVFECHPRLIDIFQASYPFIKEFYPTRKEDYLEWPLTMEPAQYKSAIGDLGRLLRRSRESFKPAAKQHLKPEADLVKSYREILETIAPGNKYVGVAWTGGVIRTMRWYRSIQPKELKRLRNDRDIVLVSLQYEDDSAMVDEWLKSGGQMLRFPAITQHYNYKYTLALVAALDEVVTVCQSVAHLSAISGQTTRVLVPDAPAWRYGLEDTDWYWYGDNAKLYRRTSASWDDALQALYKDMNIGPMPWWEAALVKDIEPGRMLELGCKRVDEYKRWFTDKGFDHTSVDLNGAGGSLKMDLQQPLELGTFDVVTNFGTTEHVEHQIPVWLNIHEALKPGGLLISTTPFPGDWEHHGKWYPTAEWWTEFAKLNGYALQSVEVVCDEPRRMIAVKATKIDNKPFHWPTVPMYCNENEDVKVGAYL